MLWAFTSCCCRMQKIASKYPLLNKLFQRITMSPLSAVGCCIMLLTSVVDSWTTLMSTSGQPICAVDPPSESFQVRSKIDCTARCQFIWSATMPPCYCVNYRVISRLCELFYYQPANYTSQEACNNIRVSSGNFQVAISCLHLTNFFFSNAYHFLFLYCNIYSLKIVEKTVNISSYLHAIWYWKLVVLLPLDSIKYVKSGGRSSFMAVEKSVCHGVYFCVFH